MNNVLYWWIFLTRKMSLEVVILYRDIGILKLGSRQSLTISVEAGVDDPPYQI